MRQLQIFILALLALANQASGAEVSAEAQAKAIRATVQVRVVGGDSTGTGTVIKKHGLHAYVLTAHHIVGDRKVEVVLAGGSSVRGEVVARAKTADVCVVRIADDKAIGGEIGLVELDAAAENVASIAWVSGDRPKATVERLQGRKRARRPGDTAEGLFWVIERPLSPGQSGGALINSDGQLIGVASGHDGKQGYFVHANEIHAMLRLAGLKWLTDDR